MRRFAGNRAVFSVLLALFLVASVGGVFASGSMNGAAAFSCPYMGIPVLCAMNPLQHLSEWQQTFATTVQQTSTVIFLLLALCAAALFSFSPQLQQRSTAGCIYRSPHSTTQRKKITGWLSLFENSPSQV
jgi:hypothetical protein